ncbi:hypothetical protein DFH08DRAFT_883461, partial [Mycena albidolilacea]
MDGWVDIIVSIAVPNLVSALVLHIELHTTFAQRNLPTSSYTLLLTVNFSVGIHIFRLTIQKSRVQVQVQV